MPTPEEIKKIAIEYAESKCSVQEYLRAYDKRDNLNEAYSKEALAVLEFLSKDYCIVPKSKLQREYKKSYSAAFEHTTCLDRQYSRGRYQVLRELFGKSLFEEEER